MTAQQLGAVIALVLIAFTLAGMRLIQWHLARSRERERAELHRYEQEVEAAHFPREKLALVNHIAETLGLTAEEAVERLQIHRVHCVTGVGGRYAVYDSKAGAYLYPQLDWGPHGVRAIGVVPATWLEAATADRWEA